jgi:hypothetical protein
MFTTRPPLKNRLVMTFMILIGLLLSIAYLAVMPSWLPKWTCYVPIILGAISALIYKHRVIKSLRRQVEPQPEL